MTSWTIAVAMAGVFSVVVGMTVAGKLNQISADKKDSTPTAATKVSAPYYTSDDKKEGSSIDETCSKGTLVAINNYPDSTTLKKISAEGDKGINQTWLDKMGEQSWKCSHVCITGFDEGDYRSEGNKEKVKRALEGATAKINDQKDTKIQVLTSSEILELMKKNPTGMKAVVNIDSLKSRCEGPNSTNYSTVNTTLGETTILKRNETNTVNISSSGSGTSSPAGIGDSTTLNKSKTTGSTSDSTASPVDDNDLGEGGASAGSAPQIAKPDKMLGYDKNNPSSVAKCWLAVADESAKHMKEHLRVYNQTDAIQIINDMTHLLFGYKNGNMSYPPLHGGSNVGKPRISEVYTDYRNIVFEDDKNKSKYKKKEATLLKECNQILERVPKFSTERTDITELKEKKERLTDTYNKIVKSELNLTNKINIPKGTYGYTGTDIKSFFDFIKAIGTKGSLLDKERYQDIKGYENVINDIRVTDELQKQLNNILKENPQVENTSAKSTITVSGNVAINNKKISSGNIVNNGNKRTIHICVYLIGDAKNCKKIKTNKSDGYFEVTFDNITAAKIKDFTNSYDSEKIKIYAVYNDTLHKVRNIYSSYPSQTSTGFSGASRVTFTNNNNGKYTLQIHSPIVLYGENTLIKMPFVYSEKPEYQVHDVNMVKKNAQQFMKDTGKDNCLLLPSGTLTDQ